jgi:hypothetical protein
MASKAQRVARTATEGLLVLWEERFFQSWKNKKAVVDALAKKHNHFSDPELGMALMRAKHLTRKGKRGNYEYIQKHPFVAGDAESPTGRKGKEA